VTVQSRPPAWQPSVQRNWEATSGIARTVTRVPSVTVVLKRQGTLQNVDGSIRISPPPPATEVASTLMVASFANVTATERSRSICSWQREADPAQSPDQASTAHPASGVASILAVVTVSPTSKVMTHRPPKGQEFSEPP